MQKNTFSFAGNIPEKYDRYLGPYLFEPFAQNLVECIKDNPQNILEIACGTGRVTRNIMNKMISNSKLVATDINPDMMALAKQRAHAPNVTWLQADAQQLPFEDATFDCVICQFAIMFFPDKQKAFNEVFRVLKSGGQFLFSTWDKIENNATSHISHLTVKRLLQDQPAFYDIPFSMYHPGELKILAHAAGFEKINIKKVTLTGHSPSAKDIAIGYTEGNPVVNEIMKINPELVETIKKEIAETINKQVSKDPVQAELSAWVGDAEK